MGECLAGARGGVLETVSVPETMLARTRVVWRSVENCISADSVDDNG